MREPPRQPVRRVTTSIDELVRRDEIENGYADIYPDTQPMYVIPVRQPLTVVSAKPRKRYYPHFLLLLLIVFALYLLINLVGSWWQTYQDDVHFGRPRTAQSDAVVGHHDSKELPSHFIAMNLNRHVEIIEFPGGDASHAKIYVGPVLLGDGQDLTPITLSFRDTNGDGKIDMIVHILGDEIVFLNDGTSFIAPRG